MRTVTSVTTFNDAVGVRMSITYSEINEQTGEIISDNNRIDRVITDSNAKGHATALSNYAQAFVDNLQG